MRGREEERGRRGKGEGQRERTGARRERSQKRGERGHKRKVVAAHKIFLEQQSGGGETRLGPVLGSLGVTEVKKLV